jgi:ankyrin repeat protein
VTEVASILEQGTDLINAEDNAGYMPIHEASLNGHIDIVKLLVEHDASFDAQSSFDQESPLLDAVENSHVSVVKYLLELGADPRKRDKQGRTCLDANQEGSESAEVRDEIENLLRNAISKQRAQRPSDDENRASVPADRESRSSRDPSVASPIHLSPPAPGMAPAANIRRRNARAEQSRKDLLWLDAGKGSLAKLREKAREGDLQMVHALLETGLKPDTESLVAAIKGGHTELVSLMLAYSAEVDPPPGQADREGSRRKREVSMPIGEDTPMLAAIGRGNVEILRYLLDNGVDPKRRDSRGKSYIDIAREREGEYWQEEVQLLKEAWQKVETKSPSRRRPSPKSSPNKQRRNSTASTSRNPSRLSTQGTKDQKALKRSASANPSHHLNEEVSDRESHTEAPKSRTTKPKRSELESSHSSALKKRRRLVSGKVRDEEAARIGDMTPVLERDSSSKKLAVSLDKPSAKIDKFDATGPVKEDTPIKKPKIEVSEDVDIDVPPLERPKIHSTRERHSAAARSNSISLEGKRPLSRNHSPPRASRSEEQRRRREEFPDDRQLRRDTDSDPRRIREGRRRDSSVSSESTRKREDPHRPVREESDKWRQTDRRLREREPEDKDIRERRARKEAVHSERKTGKEKKPKEDDKEKKPREDDQVDQWRPEEVARELLRKKHLTKELHSIQKKAEKEAAVQRDNEIISRELKLRWLREEQQRMVREREEKEQEEREAREKAERELREREEREREEQERLAREKEARERAEREEKERLEREKAEQERLAREKAEQERLAREKAEQERMEKERREREEWEAKQRELQLQEERRRQEEDRRIREEERRRLDVLRRQKEEAERQRLELERLEAEQKQRRVAEELQQQIAREKEAARIQSLPYTLRIAAQNEPCNLSTLSELYGDYIPFFSAILPSTHPITENAPPNGVSNGHEEWVLNVQVALAFGTSDLHLSTYSQLERRMATEHERWRMWSCMNGVLCKEMEPDKSTKDRLAHMAKEKQKFMTMQPVFWVKVCRPVLLHSIPSLLIMSNTVRGDSVHRFLRTALQAYS